MPKNLPDHWLQMKPVDFEEELVQIQYFRDLEEFTEYSLILIKQNRKMSTCNQLVLETLGSRMTMMPKNLPGHCMVVGTCRRWS